VLQHQKEFMRIDVEFRSIAMAFKNEYVLPLEEETSEFLISAQKVLNVMAERRSKWTVDRERDMLLYHEGRGREIEDAKHDLWSFIDRNGYYMFSTDCLTQSEASPEEIAIAYKLKNFWKGERYATPNSKTLISIKEALREYKDWGVISDYKRCQLTLIDVNSGKDI